MNALIVIAVFAAGAFVIHSLHHGDVIAMAALVLCSTVYAATFAADYLMRCWRSGR